MLPHLMKDLCLAPVDLLDLSDEGLCHAFEGLLFIKIGKEIGQRLTDAGQVIPEEIRHVRTVIFRMEIRQGILLLRPHDDPGDGQKLKEPVSPGKYVPVEDAPRSSTIAVVERVKVPDEVMQQNPYDDRVDECLSTRRAPCIVAIREGTEFPDESPGFGKVRGCSAVRCEPCFVWTPDLFSAFFDVILCRKATEHHMKRTY